MKYKLRVDGEEFVVLIEQNPTKSLTIVVGEKKFKFSPKKFESYKFFKTELGDFLVDLSKLDSNIIYVNGEPYKVSMDIILELGPAPSKSIGPKPTTIAKKVPKGAIVSPITGKVVEILKNVGDEVQEGDPIVVIESMKIRNIIEAPKAGKIREIRVRLGKPINKDDIIAIIE